MFEADLLLEHTTILTSSDRVLHQVEITSSSSLKDEVELILEDKST